MDRLGLGQLLALSGLATAIGLLGYALAPAWSAMVALGLAAGLGAGAIDAGLNAYVAVTHGPRFLNLLHACYGVGAAAGPAIMAAILAAGLSWRWGYVIVGTLQMGLGVCFLLTARSWVTARETAPATSPTEPADPTTPIWRQPLVWLSLLLFFLYTGVEVTAGEWSYSVFTEARDASPQVAALGVSVYWANLTIGRLLAGVVANRVGPVILLRTSIFGVVVGAALTWLNLSVELSFVGLGLVGLAAAPIFPSLIASTPGRLGTERAPRVIGLQVGAAALGGALLPGLAGVLAEQLGLEAIVALLVIGAAGMALLHEALVASAR